jgi:hypothetical protein
MELEVLLSICYKTRGALGIIVFKGWSRGLVPQVFLFCSAINSVSSGQDELTMCHDIIELTASILREFQCDIG